MHTHVDTGLGWAGSPRLTERFDLTKPAVALTNQYLLELHKFLCKLSVWMQFEYDPGKSISNSRKHGIDFDQAQGLWLDSNLFILPSRFPDEPRFLAVGRIDERFFTAVFTERDDKIRLISVRRAREEESKLYEQNQQN